MTTPVERTRALREAGRLLYLLSRLPSELDGLGLRELAVRVLRHYPDDGMVQLIASQTTWLEWRERVGKDIT
ncbi:BPSL0761 family protein [Paraburkholderia sprentiae]|uniref:Uncharacterized protein n=1 Tax=Paraburkholderia sprentiae WSM5005 TaxID=754502 RepID=A0A1I9YCP9_9BURK